jgi:hypothetical protein
MVPSMLGLNKMHVRFKALVKWGIDGLKRKWKCFMKIFDSTKPKFSHLFQASAFLINDLHRYWMDFRYDVVEDQNFDPIARRWARDY